MKVKFVTGNKAKLREVQMIFSVDPSIVIEAVDIDLPEYQGEPEFITTQKCLIASEKVDGPVIVEDTSLCFNCLNGLPGPYIKHFAKKLNCMDDLVGLLSSFDDKSAYALCTVGYCKGKGEEVHIFSGRTDGQIVKPRIQGAFNWDCVFKPDGFDLTYPELDHDVKNSISHRGKGFTLLMEYLNKNK